MGVRHQKNPTFPLGSELEEDGPWEQGIKLAPRYSDWELGAPGSRPPLSPQLILCMDPERGPPLQVLRRLPGRPPPPLQSRELWAPLRGSLPGPYCAAALAL